MEFRKSTCICKTPLHPIKVGVWIAASRRRLIAFIVKIKESVINEVTSPLFFYLVPQYVTKRQKSNIFEFHRTLDICSFIDTLYFGRQCDINDIQL
jgi:hypothetical protein